MVDFGYDGKLRPAVVVSLPDRNCRLAISSVVQVTTQFGETPYEVALPRVPWLREQSYCNSQTIQPVKWVEFQRKLGMLESPVIKQIKLALEWWLGL